ncbi:hypothetical protein BHM03_00024402 [Ensete ventricosum]|nr:hypothetical protein BHM03_00024402 [Ensete ventricosum]
MKLGSEGLDTGQEDAEASVTQEWVSEGQLPKERIQSEVAEAPRRVGRGHTLKYYGPSLSHRNLNAIEMSPEEDMVQRIVMEQFEAIQHTRTRPMRDLIMRMYDQELLGAPLR